MVYSKNNVDVIDEMVAIMRIPFSTTKIRIK